MTDKSWLGPFGVVTEKLAVLVRHEGDQVVGIIHPRALVCVWPVEGRTGVGIYEWPSESPTMPRLGQKIAEEAYLEMVFKGYFPETQAQEPKP